MQRQGRIAGNVLLLSLLVQISTADFPASVPSAGRMWNLSSLNRFYFLCLCKASSKPARTYRSVRAGKAQPIFLPAGRQGCGIFPFLHISSAKIGSEKHNCIDHFAPNNKQDGMNCFCCTLDADRVIKMNYATVLFGRFVNTVSHRLIFLAFFQEKRWNEPQ
jgi:hypothetical protein